MRACVRALFASFSNHFNTFLAPLISREERLRDELPPLGGVGEPGGVPHIKRNPGGRRFLSRVSASRAVGFYQCQAVLLVVILLFGLSGPE